MRGSLVRSIAGDLTYTENAGLCTRDLMTHPDGWNIPLARLNDASWSSFVSMCFQSVPLASGGTEARYRLAEYCSLQDPLKETTARMLATCDEKIYETADGDFGIIDGQSSEPDMTINGDDILSVQMSDGFDPFIGAISYGITPTNIPGVTRSGAIVTIDPGATLSLANIQDTTGAATGVALAVSFTGNPNIDTTSPPGRRRNLDGRVIGLAAYAGNLHSTNIVRSSLFINSGVTASPRQSR